MIKTRVIDTRKSLILLMALIYIILQILTIPWKQLTILGCWLREFGKRDFRGNRSEDLFFREHPDFGREKGKSSEDLNTFFSLRRREYC